MAGMMPLLIGVGLGTGLGCVLGAVAARRAAERSAGARLRQLQDRAEAAEARLESLTRLTSTLRHDLRGILSPALLACDRLLESGDPGIRKTGEIVERTIGRAVARMSETKIPRPKGAEQENAQP